MKKILAVCMALLLALSFAACGKKGDLGKQTTKSAEGIVEYNTVDTFDFGDYKKETADKAVTEGFVNAEKSACFDKGTAKKLAVKELTDGFTYDTVKIAFDRTEGVWKVSYIASAANKSENVCIDSDGLTVLIVKE